VGHSWSKIDAFMPLVRFVLPASYRRTAFLLLAFMLPATLPRCIQYHMPLDFISWKNKVYLEGFIVHVVTGCFCTRVRAMRMVYYPAEHAWNGNTVCLVSALKARTGAGGTPPACRSVLLPVSVLTTLSQELLRTVCRAGELRAAVRCSCRCRASPALVH